MTCIKCGGDMTGDGYTSVIHCENLTDEDQSDEGYMYAAPDEGPFYCDFEDVLKPFVVTVGVMKESCGTTYWVCLDQGNRSKDAKPWDDGRLTPFKHGNREYVEIEAKKWAEFLGVEVTD